MIVTSSNAALKLGDGTGSEGYMNIYLNNVSGGAKHIIQSYPTAGGGFAFQNLVNDQAITFETKNSSGTTKTPLILNGDGSVIFGKLFKDKVDVTVSDTYGNPGDGYSDMPITSDTSNERFRLLESAGTNGVDLPSLTDAEFGKEVYIYSDSSGSGGNNMVLVFATQSNPTSTLTFSGNVFGASIFTWYGTYWATRTAV